MKPREGKEAISFEGYVALCKIMYQMEPVGHRNTWPESIFANLYLRLQFATIGRTDNIETLMLSHFDWDQDAFTILFCSTKADKDGTRTNERKHIYANPFQPEICCMLSLAIYTMYVDKYV